MVRERGILTGNIPGRAKTVPSKDSGLSTFFKKLGFALGEAASLRLVNHILDL